MVPVALRGARMADAPPAIVVLAGPNGAGKTTCAQTVLAETLRLLTYVNADVIAQGLSGFSPESSALAAGRIMLARLDELASQRVSFAFETTLAGRTLAVRLRLWRQAGCVVHLIYFWLTSADLAVSRVAQRAARGGHSVPEPTIRQRYDRSRRNFFWIYRPLVTSWKVYDNSHVGQPPALVAEGHPSTKEVVLQETVWSAFQKESRQ
jgi:predicted ABC-type ATPase